MPNGDFQAFTTGIAAAMNDGRLSGAIKVFGPKKISDENSRVILTVPGVDADFLIEFLTTYRKKRAMAKKSNLIMRVDPYTLS